MKQLCNEVLFYNLNILPLKKSLKLNSPPQSRKTEEDTHTHQNKKKQQTKVLISSLYLFVLMCVFSFIPFSFHCLFFLSQIRRLVYTHHWQQQHALHHTHWIHILLTSATTRHSTRGEWMLFFFSDNHPAGTLF